MSQGPPQTDNNTIFADVLAFQQKAATLSTTYGLPTEIKCQHLVGLPPFEIGVPEASIERPSGFLFTSPYVQYNVCLTRRSDNRSITIGKRYSELLTFNTEIHKRDLIRKIDAPQFPDKKVFSTEWWTFQTHELEGNFVNSRKEELHYYLKKLFIGNPELIDEQYVVEFFKINEFDQIAYEQDMKKKQQEGVMKMNNFGSGEEQCLPAGAPHNPSGTSAHSYTNTPTPPTNHGQSRQSYENHNSFANQTDPTHQISSSSIYSNSYRENLKHSSAAPNYVYNKHGSFNNQNGHIGSKQSSLYDV